MRRQGRYSHWDGTIRLFNKRTRMIYAGLREEVESLLRKEGCEVTHYSDFEDYTIEPEEVEGFVEKISPSKKPRSYQFDCLMRAIQKRRAVFLSPTGSGKSLIIYLITRCFDMDTLLVVPTVGLVKQMASDFVDYGMDPDDIHQISAGADKDVKRKVTITTWQSIYKMPAEWFERYKVVLGDEVHTWKAKSLIGLMLKMPNCCNRFGFTGTLDGTECNEMLITGLFGPVYQATTTMEQVEAGNLARPVIHVLELGHSPGARRACYNASYQDEVDIILGSSKRLAFVRNLALDMKGNTLVLFNYVGKHGELLYQDILKHAGDRKVHFVWGGVDGSDREQIRHNVEADEDAIVVASYGTFQLGINIVNLRNLILAWPTKSKVRVLQSIGRVLRMGERKKKATIIDISDNLCHNDWRNFTMNHMVERVKVYAREGFDYRINPVDL